MKNRLSTLALVIVVIILLGSIFMNNKTSKKILKFASASTPFSADPMEYDYYIHHYAMTSVLGNLVSSVQKGEITPQIAESWTSDKTAKKWTFQIRKNLKYSNGDTITAQDFELSLRRIAYLQKKSESNSGLLENLINYEQIESIETVKGITSKGNELFLDFAEPMPDLLVKISFGFYSLSHPSLYDHKTGAWFNKMNVISSNAYDVMTWNENTFELKLRENIPYVNYANAVEKVSFLNLGNVKEAKDLVDVDILVADKSTLMTDTSFEFIGSSVGYKIGYAECYQWQDKNSPMSSLENRKWLRKKFYEGLRQSDFQTINLFFPFGMPKVKELDLRDDAIKPENLNFTLITHTLNKASKIKENENKKSVQEILDQGLKNLGKDSNIKVHQIDYKDGMQIEKEMHLAVNGTGIEADEFMDTVKFMFFSKQGINLPDLTGAIRHELNQINPDINIINKEIWDQALIWPVRHYTVGYWFKKDSLINYEKINLDLPAIDFQFIKWK